MKQNAGVRDTQTVKQTVKERDRQGGKQEVLRSKAEVNQQLFLQLIRLDESQFHVTK